MTRAASKPPCSDFWLSGRISFKCSRRIWNQANVSYNNWPFLIKYPYYFQKSVSTMLTHLISFRLTNGTSSVTGLVGVPIMNILLFDCHLNLCQASVHFVLDREETTEIRFAALQSSQGKLLLTRYGISGDCDHSLVLLDNGECLIKSDAALQTASYLNLPWCLMNLFRFLPKRFRDRFYDLVAGNRYSWFGRQEECLIPSPELKKRFLEDGYSDEFAGTGERCRRI